MKKFLNLLIIVVLFSFYGCSSSTSNRAPYPSASPAPAEMSLDEVLGPNKPMPGDERSLILVISDLHLGDQRSIDNRYGWLIKNRDMLTHFLNQMAIHPSVKELVIAVDMFNSRNQNRHAAGRHSERKCMRLSVHRKPDSVKTVRRNDSKIAAPPPVKFARPPKTVQL